jgi:dTMP kinase
MSKTKVIVIEGMDGVGKATQTDLLVKMLRTRFDGHLNVVKMSFPRYDLPWGKVIKSLLSNTVCHTPNGTYITPLEFSENLFLKSSLYLNNFAECKEELDAIVNNENPPDFIVFDRYIPSMVTYSQAGLKIKNQHYLCSSMYGFLNHNFQGLKIDLQFNLLGDLDATRVNIKKRYEDKTVVDLHEQNDLLLLEVSDYYSKANSVDAIKTLPGIYNDTSDIHTVNCVCKSSDGSVNMLPMERIAWDIYNLTCLHFNI